MSKYYVRLTPEAMQKFNDAGTPCYSGTEYLGRIGANNSFGFGSSKEFAHLFDSEKNGPDYNAALALRNKTTKSGVEISSTDVIVEDV